MSSSSSSLPLPIPGVPSLRYTSGMQSLLLAASTSSHELPSSGSSVGVTCPVTTASATSSMSQSATIAASPILERALPSFFSNSGKVAMSSALRLKIFRLGKVADTKRKAYDATEEEHQKAIKELENAKKKVDSCSRKALASQADYQSVKDEIGALEQDLAKLQGSSASSSSNQDIEMSPVSSEIPDDTTDSDEDVPLKRSRPSESLQGTERPTKRHQVESSTTSSSSSPEHDLKLLTKLFKLDNVYYNKKKATITGFDENSKQFTITQDNVEIKAEKKELIYVPSEGDFCLLKENAKHDAHSRYYRVKILRIIKSPEAGDSKIVHVEVEWPDFRTREKVEIRHLDTLVPITENDPILETLKFDYVASRDNPERIGKGYYLSEKL